MNSRNRDVVLDIARSLCIIEIVGFWHLIDYIKIGAAWEWIIIPGRQLTTCALATFTFLSGWFMRKHHISSFRDVKAFYVKRLKRFWIPFFIAATSIYIITLLTSSTPWFNSPYYYCLTILGLAWFVQPMPLTLWYMDMLMLFYLISPAFFCFRNKWYKIVIAFLFTILAGALSWKFGLDRRIVYYMPLYFWGGVSEYVIHYAKKYSILSLLAASIILWLSFQYNPFEIIHLGILLIIGPLFYISCSSILYKFKIFNKLSAIISYSSMNMYLFHRIIYLLFIICYDKASNGASMLTIWPMILIAFPIVIIFSYTMQKGYDKIINLCSDKIIGADPDCGPRSPRSPARPSAGRSKDG